VPTGPPTNCIALIYLKYNDIHISNAKDPFNLDADPGSALEKKSIRIRIQVMNISLRFTKYF